MAILATVALGTSAESAQTEATLVGVWVGAGVALFAALIGNVLGPMLLEIFRDRRLVRREAREGRRGLIVGLHEAAQAAGLKKARAGDSTTPEYAAAVDDFVMRVATFRLGGDSEADRRIRNAIMRASDKVRNDKDVVWQWTATAGLLTLLDALVDKPKTWRQVVSNLEEAAEAFRIERGEKPEQAVAPEDE